LAVLISASTLTPIFTSLLTSTLLFMIHTMTGYIFACTYSIMRTYISSLPILFTFSYDTLPSSIFYHTSGIPPPPQSIKPPAPSVVSMSGSPSYLHNLPNKYHQQQLWVQEPPTVGQLITRFSPIRSTLIYWRALSPPSAGYFPQLPTPIRDTGATGHSSDCIGTNGPARVPHVFLVAYTKE
jgi:hypothetical protein